MSKKLVKGETYFDQATGLERRHRIGGSATDGVTKTVGSKREVWNGSAEKTSGGLNIDKLGRNKRGHIVSVAKFLQGKQRIGQLAQSPYFGRIQDLNAIRRENNTPTKKPTTPTKGKRTTTRPATTGPATTGPKSPRMARAGSYVDDISRLGGVGFQYRAPAVQPFPPMPHMAFPLPMPSPYGFSQPSYSSMY